MLKADGGTLRFIPAEACASLVGDALAGTTPLHRLTLSSNSVGLLGETLFLVRCAPDRGRR